MTAKPKTIATCPSCGHVHAGASLGGICVGCPCPLRFAKSGAVTDTSDLCSRCNWSRENHNTMYPCATFIERSAAERVAPPDGER